MNQSAILEIGRHRRRGDRIPRLDRLVALGMGKLAICAALAGIIMLGVAASRTMAARQDAAGGFARTLRGLDVADGLDTDYAAAVREAHSFLVDRSLATRRRFERAAHAAEAAAFALRDARADQAGESALADRLYAVLDARLMLLREAMDHAGPPSASQPVGGAEDPAQGARLERGLAIGDAVASAIAALRTDQRLQLEQQAAAIDRAARGIPTALVISAICLACSALLAVLLRRRALRRQAGLEAINARLEKCLTLRTDSLNASEAKLRTYLTQLADGLSVIRVEPGGRLTYEEINAAARTILGLGDQNVVGMAPHEVYQDADRPELEERLRECLQTEALIRYNVVIFTPAGRRELRVSIAPVYGVATPHHPQGRIERLLQSMRDVTGEAEREERLRQSQRVEAIGRLTAGVAHDFNNLLQALMGGLELAISDLADRPETATSINTALQAARRGALLTSQLLSFSRQQILRPIAVDIDQQLHDLANTLGRTLGHAIRINVAVEPGLPPAHVDPTHLNSALFNLALNARDAMAMGGTLQIEAFSAGSELVVAVSDTGSGMSPEVLARACEPFFTTKGTNGSGLGLSMVHGFARQSGGDLRISSDKTHGTRVEIALLAAPERIAVDAPDGGQTMALGSGRVLLVDDEEDVRQVTSAFLRKAGFDVTEARDANAALAVLSTGRMFEALVTDYAMPGMNGVDLVMQAREAAAGLPALIITGYAGAEGLRWLPPDVMVLRKPFKRASFVQAVKDLIESAGHTPAADVLPAVARRLDPQPAGAAATGIAVG